MAGCCPGVQAAVDSPKKKTCPLEQGPHDHAALPTAISWPRAAPAGMNPRCVAADWRWTAGAGEAELGANRLTRALSGDSARRRATITSSVTGAAVEHDGEPAICGQTAEGWDCWAPEPEPEEAAPLDYDDDDAFEVSAAASWTVWTGAAAADHARNINPPPADRAAGSTVCWPADCELAAADSRVAWLPPTPAAPRNLYRITEESRASYSRRSSAAYSGGSRQSRPNSTAVGDCVASAGTEVEPTQPVARRSFDLPRELSSPQLLPRASSADNLAQKSVVAAARAPPPPHHALVLHF